MLQKAVSDVGRGTMTARARAMNADPKTALASRFRNESADDKGTCSGALEDLGDSPMVYSNWRCGAMTAAPRRTGFEIMQA